jgi:hypothetical protein
MSTPAMTDCWVTCLGDCSDKLSREHLVSRAFFSAGSIVVQGMPWCKGEPKEIGIDSAVSKLLCTRHNSALSPLDLTAGRFAAAVREHCRLYTERSQSRRSDLSFRRLDIDARLLERWLLKTMINLNAGGQLIIGEGPGSPGRPTETLVNAVFGKKMPQGQFGMHVATRVGMRLDLIERVSFAPLIFKGTEIHGSFFNVHGLLCYLSATEAGPPLPFSQIPGVDEDWRHSNVIRRLRRIQAVLPNGRLSHEMRFKWW